MDDRYTIDTPENIAFDYDIAGIGSRFIATLIDTFLIILFIIAMSMVLGILLPLLNIQLDLSENFLIWLLVGGLFLLLIAYYVIFEMIWNGQTPGKRTVRLRVVRQGGLPVTFVAVALRNLLRLVDFLPSFYGVGVVTMFIDGQSRRLGDFAAGTLVVRERAAVSLDALTASSSDAAPPADAVLTLPNINLITAEDYTLIQEFLRRRPELNSTARARLGQQLAEPIQERLGVTVEPRYNEDFLTHVATEYQVIRRKEQQETLG